MTAGTTPVITLVTGNPNKLRELEAVAPDGFQFAARRLDLPEIQSLDVRDIVADKLRRAYQAIGGPVVVEDVSAELARLGGLPGPFVKFFEQRLGNDALYQLSKQPDDAVVIRCVAGYYDGQAMRFGEGLLRGTICAPRGENGFGFDSVVVPDGEPHSRTLAEMTADEKNAISHRRLALQNLLAQFTV